ncbi:hypothetical protein BH11BAC4_BH11BAC4_26930 [soil metagenome]
MYFSTMKAATVKEIKTELENLPPQELMPLTLRLAKFKKENKELLTYLLFEANDEQGYIKSVKADIDGLFEEINHDSLYYVKKTLRKTLRLISRFARYSNAAQTGVELLIYFCQKIKEAKIPMHKSSALTNLYSAQLKKIKKEISSMHEDLQYDYLKAMEKL